MTQKRPTRIRVGTHCHFLPVGQLPLGRAHGARVDTSIPAAMAALALGLPTIPPPTMRARVMAPTIDGRAIAARK
jgi:hypothetical protein